MTIPHRKLEVHGFSDASLQAYGACIYVRSIDADGRCNVQLLTAKSRVAPLSSKSIPRLELSAALLLAHLLAHVMKSTSLEAPVYLWTDSTITLDWISAPPSTWKTFVCNSVAEIQELTSTSSWNHVPSEQNPADLLSRGSSLEHLIENALWWHGSLWIRSLNEPWPPSRKQNPEDPELRKVVALPVFTEPETSSIATQASLRSSELVLGGVVSLKTPVAKKTIVSPVRYRRRNSIVRCSVS